MATILLIAFRGWPNARLTPGKLSLTSLLLAVCLPVWPPDGDPLALWVGLAATCPFTDCGEFGTHGAAQLAGAVLAVYFTSILLLLGSVVWIARRHST